MAIALKGDLETTSVGEVIKRLVDDRASGLLRVMGEGEAKIYFDDGKIVYAVSDEAVEGEVVPLLAGWLKGTFSFIPNVEAPGVNVEEATEELLDRLVEEGKKWKELKKAGIHRNAGVQLASGIRKEATVTPEEWEVVIALGDGEKSCEDLMDVLNMEFLDLGRILLGMAGKGLVEFSGGMAEEEVISQEELDKLEEELTKLLGPMGEVFLEEVLEAFREGEGPVARKYIPRIVDALAEYIPDKDKRVEFQKRAALVLSKEE